MPRRRTWASAARRRSPPASTAATSGRRRGSSLCPCCAGSSGRSQGITLMSLLRGCFPDDLQRLNAMKIVLTAVANGVAAILFIAVADVAWEAAALIALGSTVGAQVAARYGRAIPSEVLRWIVVIGGTIVALVLIFT